MLFRSLASRGNRFFIQVRHILKKPKWHVQHLFKHYRLYCCVLQLQVCLMKCVVQRQKVLLSVPVLCEQINKNRVLVLAVSSLSRVVLRQGALWQIRSAAFLTSIIFKSWRAFYKEWQSKISIAPYIFIRRAQCRIIINHRDLFKTNCSTL